MNGERQAPSSLLRDRLQDLATDLCSSLGSVFSSALDGTSTPGSSDGGLRPVQLTSNLGIDKSLASRVVRALGEDDPLRALHGMPTPQGLFMIARAAGQSGASEESLHALDRATQHYKVLLAEFSGGRTDLEATLTGWLPEHRARAERDARRSIFRGMTSLSGTRTSANYNSLYLVPSAKPGRVDSLLVAVRQDLRRLRPDARTLVANFVVDGTKDAPHRLAIDGEEATDDPESFLLRELCSHPIPKIDVTAEEGRIVMDIAPDAIDVNEFTTIGLGWRMEGHFPAFRSPGEEYGSLCVSSPRPTEALVFDVFVHEDVELGGDLLASVRSQAEQLGARQIAPPSQEEPPGAATRAGAPSILTLSSDPGGLSSADVRSAPAIAENVCREAGFEVAQFEAFRARIGFPLATEQLTVWWPLPARP